MPIIEVDGEQVEFPDDMSDQEIVTAIQNLPSSDANTEKPGIIDRAASDLSKRSQKVQDSFSKVKSGQKPIMMLPLDIVGNAAGLASDLSGEYLSSAFSALPEGLQNTIKTGSKNALSAIGSIPLGGGENTVGSMANSALQKYGDFAQNNPNAADLIGDTVNIGGLLTGGTSNPVTRSTGAALSKVGEGAVDATKATGRGIQSAITPTVAPEIAPLVQRAQDMGFKLRLDQVAPTRARKTVQKISQEVPFSGVDANDALNLTVFNRNAAKSIGQDADNLGPETIKNFLSSASDKFDNTLKGEIIPVTPGVVMRLDEILTDADLSMTGDLKDIVAKNIQKFKDDSGLGTVQGYTGGNTISGEKLSSFRSQLLKRIPKAPAESKQALGEIVDTLDSMIEKSLSPEKQEILTQARREWRNYKTLEPLLEKSTDGLIDPPRLLQRVASSPYIKASRQSVGEDDLVDLARIGNELLTKPGGSDTFQKMALGGASVATLMNPVTGLKALGGMAANRGYQSLYNQSPALVKLAASKGAKKGNGSKVFLENAGDPALKKLIKQNTK